MVFKRVLKGIGRLMLTTAVMCGVGLFLCSSEVKAAVSVNLEAEKDQEGNSTGGFKVTIKSVIGDDISSLKSVKLYKDDTVIYSVDNLTGKNITVGSDYEYTVSKDKFITGGSSYR